MKKKLIGLLMDEQGQGMVEYGLIIGIVSIAAIAALALLAPEIVGVFTDVTNALP